MKQYLLDASSFITLIKKAEAQRTIEFLRESVILDLTYYEVGNAIWKESTLTKFLTPDEYKALSNVAQTVLAKTDRITVDANTFQGILELARSERLSFYDSSYVYFAKDKGLVLVTEDKELKAKAQKHANVQTTAMLIR